MADRHGREPQRDRGGEQVAGLRSVGWLRIVDDDSRLRTRLRTPAPPHPVRLRTWEVAKFSRGSALGILRRGTDVEMTMQPDKKIDLNDVDEKLTQAFRAELEPTPEADSAGSDDKKWPAPFRASGGKHASG